MPYWLKVGWAILSCFWLHQESGHRLIVLGFLSFPVFRAVFGGGKPPQPQGAAGMPACMSGHTGCDSPWPQDVSCPQFWRNRLCACRANPSVNPAGGQDHILSLAHVLDHRAQNILTAWACLILVIFRKSVMPLFFKFLLCVWGNNQIGRVTLQRSSRDSELESWTLYLQSGVLTFLNLCHKEPLSPPAPPDSILTHILRQ